MFSRGSRRPPEAALFPKIVYLKRFGGVWALEHKREGKACRHGDGGSCSRVKRCALGSARRYDWSCIETFLPQAAAREAGLQIC